MWNVRYFIVPLWPNGWRDSFRGYASMMLESEPIYPEKQQFEGPGGSKAVQDWTESTTSRSIRNRREHPRAWVVHSLRRLPPIESLRPGTERQTTMQEITYDNDPIWNDPTHQVFDFHRVAWVGPEDMTALLPYARGGSTSSAEAVKVTYPSPQRVELDVTLESPGVVVLADVYYPGWELTIDGVPAPIYRINRIMRGAAGRHGTSSPGLHLRTAVLPSGPDRLGRRTRFPGPARPGLLSSARRGFARLRPGRHRP